MPRRSNFSVKFLSVIIPAYKKEKIIVKNIKTIKQALDVANYKYEIIVVVDGLIDNTYKKASTLKSKNIKILGYEKNQGKGYAIRYGMLHAKGEVIGFIDAGMDIHPAGLKMLISHMEWYNADVIIGSKLHPVSKVRYPLQRTVLSWGYRLLTRMLFGLKVRDTQVGIKFFKKRVIKDILPVLVVKSYAFDVEVLAVAYGKGYNRIYEAPVEINFDHVHSVVSKGVWKVMILMLLDTFAVFYRVQVLHHYDRQIIPKKRNLRTKAHAAYR